MKLKQTIWNKPVIGLAGGIGAGKSSVARILQSRGAVLIDSDRLAHEELQQPEVAATLRSWWGRSVSTADGGIDRRAVADIVFNRPEQLRRLEELLYPRIEARRAVLMTAYDADPNVRAMAIDAPKLYEAGVDAQCDAVIFVESHRQVRLERLRESRGWNEAELQRREGLQNPLDGKKSNADYIVVNNTSIEELRPKVEQVFTSILEAFNETRSQDRFDAGS